jgi:hypothetical protein
MTMPVSVIRRRGMAQGNLTVKRATILAPLATGAGKRPG